MSIISEQPWENWYQLNETPTRLSTVPGTSSFIDVTVFKREYVVFVSETTDGVGNRRFGEACQ